MSLSSIRSNVLLIFQHNDGDYEPDDKMEKPRIERKRKVISGDSDEPTSKRTREKKDRVCKKKASKNEACEQQVINVVDTESENHSSQEDPEFQHELEDEAVDKKSEEEEEDEPKMVHKPKPRSRRAAANKTPDEESEEGNGMMNRSSIAASKERDSKVEFVHQGSNQPAPLISPPARQIRVINST